MTQKSTLLAAESLSELAPPCLSLYQPAHRQHPENQQDPIRFRNLVKELEASLRQAYPAVETRLLLEPFEVLAHDHDFWNHTLGGLAVLVWTWSVSSVPASADGCRTGRRGRQLSHQASSTLPTIGRSRSSSRAEPAQDSTFRGRPQRARRNRSCLGSVAGDHRRVEQCVDRATPAAGGFLRRCRRGEPAHAPQPGWDKGSGRYRRRAGFRAIDRAVLEYHFRPSGPPLVLAALPEHHHCFHKVSHNPLRFPDGIMLNLDSVPEQELHALAWQVVEPHISSAD